MRLLLRQHRFAEQEEALDHPKEIKHRCQISKMGRKVWLPRNPQTRKHQLKGSSSCCLPGSLKEKEAETNSFEYSLKRFITWKVLTQVDVHTLCRHNNVCWYAMRFLIGGRTNTFNVYFSISPGIMVSKWHWSSWWQKVKNFLGLQLTWKQEIWSKQTWTNGLAFWEKKEGTEQRN